MTIQVLSQGSVDNLRSLVAKKHDILNIGFDELVDAHNCQLLDLDIEFKADCELVLPDGKTQDKNNDTRNCLLIKDILPNLTDVEATDERLWVTLALRDFKQYAMARWPADGSKEDYAKYSAKHVLRHWFARQTQSLISNNAISRLWWYQNLCGRISPENLEQNLELLLFNSDYRSSMLERTSTSSITSVVSTILTVTAKYKKRGIEYRRDKFRDFMKRLDMLAGRSHFAALNDEQLMEKIERIYLDANSK